jgi:hypothetical protein
MVDFDPAKNAINLSKQVYRWRAGLIWKFALVNDDRFQYGEPRYRAYGLIDDLAHCLVFTIRDGQYRPISLRRAHAKEMKRHAPKT